MGRPTVNKSGRQGRRATIKDVAVKQDRATGNRSAFWDERSYMRDPSKFKAAPNGQST